ncbi:MAG: SCO family protein [Pirellulaceae bacterium]
MRKRQFWVVITCVSSLLLAFGCNRSPITEGGSLSVPDDEYVAPEGTLTEFQLTDQQGKPFDSKSLHGQVWSGSVFFSKCPTSCFQQNVRVGDVQRQFQDQGLKVVSVTCDPKTDTPGALWEYAKKFDANPEVWYFLTDKHFEYLKKVANDIFRLPMQEYTHSDQVVLFDRNGKIYGTYAVLQTTQALQLKKDIAKLLGHSEAEPDVDSESEASNAKDVEPAVELDASVYGDAADTISDTGA